MNFVVTTLHNFLIVLQEQSAIEIDRASGTQKFINLLNNSNDKLLTLVSDCLLKMASYNLNAKLFIQNSEECVQRLLFIFDASKYDKLLLIISKLFPTISSGNEIIKRVFLQSNALSIFEKQIKATKSIRIRHNCLIALRNISDQATRMVSERRRSVAIQTNLFVVAARRGLAHSTTSRNSHDRRSAIRAVRVGHPQQSNRRQSNE